MFLLRFFRFPWQTELMSNAHRNNTTKFAMDDSANRHFEAVARRAACRYALLLTRFQILYMGTHAILTFSSDLIIIRKKFVATCRT